MSFKSIGPIAGGPFINVDHKVPRAVNRRYFKEVCPNPLQIDTKEVSKDYGGDLPVDEMMDRWVERLNKEQGCVSMKAGTDQIFDFK